MCPANLLPPAARPVALFFCRGDKRFAFGRSGDDDQILKEDRTRGGAPAARVRAGSDGGLPEDFTLEIKRDDSGLAEERIDAFTVRDRSVRGVAVFDEHPPIRILREIGFNRSRPELLARIAVEADQMTDEIRLLANVAEIHSIAGPAGDEDTITDDNRAGRSRPGQGSLPSQVFFRPPLDGDRRGFGTDTGAIRSAKS